MALIERCAGLRPGPMTSPLAAAKHALRGLARRWQQLQVEIREHERLLGRPDRRRSHRRWSRRSASGPTPPPRCSSSPATTPTGSARRPPGRKLCGVCPVPASSGKTTPLPAQPRRPPPGQRRALPHRHRPDALPPADHRLRRPPDRRGQDQGRDHPLPQALRRSGGLGRTSTRAPPGGRRRISALDDYRSFNALAETVNGLYKAELINRGGPWRSVEQVELATSAWVHWWNTQRLHWRLRRHPASRVRGGILGHRSGDPGRLNPIPGVSIRTSTVQSSCAAPAAVPHR